MSTVFERLQKVIVEQLDVKEKDVSPSASLVDDLNADSLDLVELITAIEEEFSVPGKKLEISDEDAEMIQTVQGAVDYLIKSGIADE
jgi:acyl carrier protein